jgi:long-chain acyl-CoA synthetase
VLLIESTIQLKKILNVKQIQLIIMYNKPSSEDIILAEKCGSIIISFIEFMNNVNKDEINIFIPNIYNDQSSIATILYPSNSYYPKGINVTYSMITHSLSSIINEFGNDTINIFMKSERFISYLPLNNCMSQIMDIYLPILSAGTIWFADKNTLIKKSSLVDILLTVNPTIFLGNYSTWNNINVPLSNIMTHIFPSNILIKKIGLNKCKLCINIDTMLSNDIRLKFKNMGIILYDWYYFPETLIVSISLPNKYKEKSVGQIINGIQIKLAPDNEILIKGKHILISSNIDDMFDKNKWFKTGDFGQLDKDGYLYIIGKKKQTIILKTGHSIFPDNIEKNLKEELIFNNLNVNHIVLLGNDRKYLSVMIDLHKNELYKYKKNKYDIEKKINFCINKINKLFPQQKIQKFIVCPNNFKIGKELSGSSDEIRRIFIEKIYKKIIDKLYI